MKPVIYQIVVRYFGNTNTTNQQDGTIETNGCGKFADITETALQALKDLGVTHVWLTGCLRQATLTGYPEDGLPSDDPDVVKGRAGSLFAVRDYFDCARITLSSRQTVWTNSGPWWTAFTAQD